MINPSEQRRILSGVSRALFEIQFSPGRKNDAAVKGILREGLNLCDETFVAEPLHQDAPRVAESILKVLDFDEADPLFHATQAHLLLKKGDRSAAIKAALAAQKLDPQNPRRAQQLAQIFNQQFEEPQTPRDLYGGYNSLVTLGQVIQLEPNNREAILRYIDRARWLEMHNESVQMARHFAATYPDDAEAHGILANAECTVGNLDESRRAFVTAIVKDPQSGINWRNQFEYFPKIPTRADIDLLVQLVSQAQKPADKIELQFALGMAYDAHNELDKAFLQFDAAHQLSEEVYFREPFDHQELVDDMKRVCQARPIEQGFQHRQVPKVTKNPRPIFVIGLPRSGTTLVQQLLASHKNDAGDYDVFPGGELTLIQKAFKIAKYQQGHGLKVKDVKNLLAELHFRYQEAVMHQFGLTREGPYQAFVDKNVKNLFHMELISTLYPDCSIIHVSRNLLDNGLSLYKRNFLGQPDFRVFNNLGRFGRYAKEVYIPFMKHWQAFLGPQTFLEVSYEDLVQKPEETTRRIIAHCGLSWSDACLSPHLTPVPNPTEPRARQPIYKSSVGSWQKYERHLGALIEIVGDGTF